MFKNYGYFYANNEDDLHDIEDLFDQIGIHVAYVSSNGSTLGGSLIKQVPDPNQDDENA